MKTSTLEKNQVSEQMAGLVARLVALIPWPVRRSAMGDVAVTLLDGKPRVAEDAFGWNRNAVKLGMNELRTGIRCIDDISNRHKPKVEEKNPKLLSDIKRIVDPKSQADQRLRTTLLYSELTAKSVYDALLEEGWTKEDLPTPRTISNILNRHNYRLRTVEKSQVQKKLRRQTRSSKMSGK